ncbi:VOC family protein [Streptomyces sp. NPDC101225]|uniref:VOC family protein n=1 Tax=Streptomyces sp. NPDC101225 TaxID=3366135 RepID=UPI003800F755
MSGITHLRSIDICVESPQELLDFYEQTWGLCSVRSPQAGTRVELRARGREHHVLALCTDSGSPARICLGAASAADVDMLAERLRTAGAEIVTAPGPRTHAGGGYAVEARDPEGRLIEVSAGLDDHAESMDTAHGPDRLSHIVLNSVDLAASKKFYTEVLGFQVSDWYEDEQMVFLRCNPVHHCLVLAPGKWTSLNHVAFEVASADEVMKALGRMRKAGYDSIWGPGRHGPGGNVFCYFVDPAGNVIEYTAELLEVDDTWVPQEWARTQGNADMWGTSGGITPDVIAAMANPPRSAGGEGKDMDQ